MEFGILGPLEVRREGDLLPLGGAKQRALLAILLLNANRVVSSDRLIDALWEDQPPETARKALQVHISQLRKLLGKERIVTQARGYALELQGEELDLARFERLREQGGLQALKDALALWRGPPLADFAYERFAQSEIARLEELRLGALEQRIDADLEKGRHADLVGELEALVKEHPLRERLQGQLMLALYRSGRQADALSAYQEARRALVEELGIEPGKSLRELHQAILRQGEALDLIEVEPQDGAARTAFVGREAELAELLQGLEDALAGRGRLFLLMGEPGIGKSRLADELIRRAAGRGVKALVGRCWEAGGAPAYWPWVQSLRSYIRGADGATLSAQLGAGAAELAQILPELRELLPGLPTAASPDSEGARFRLFDATAELLRRASEHRPLVLVLDDLHAADAPSLLLLQFVARELGPMRMLVLGAFRDVDPVPGQPLAAMLAEVSREPVTRRLSLGGLSREDVAEYVELTAAEIASPELAARLHEETEGNPLFVGETVRLLAVEGLPPDSPRAGIAIPQSVRHVIARRLAHLSEECNRVLALASVLGREFSLDVVARLAGASPDELLDTLDEATAARVVSELPGRHGGLRFGHVLIRDTLYEGLSTALRVRLHRLVVEALEALYGDDSGPHLAELAHHALGGRDFEKGLQYAWRAGDRTLTLFAYEEAARLYQLGLEALEAARAGPAKKCDLLLALGHAQVRAGDSGAAKQTFLQATAVARELERPEALAHAALGYGGRFVWARAGGDDRLVALLREALGAVDKRDAALRSRLLARLSTALRDDFDPRPRAALSEEAVDLARSAGDPATLAYALVARYAATWSAGNEVERLAVSTDLVDLAKSTGDKEREVEGHGFRFHSLLEFGEVEAADSELAGRAGLTNEMRQPAQSWVHLMLEGLRHVLVGQFEAAEETIHGGFELGRVAGDEARATFEAQRFVVRREQGRLAEVESSLEGCLQVYPNRPIFRCLLANLSIELDRVDEARRRLAALAADDFRALPPDNDWLFGVTLLAETGGSLDDPACATLYRLLLPHAQLNVVGGIEVSTGAVSRHLGMLASSLKRFDDAEGHFEHALGLNSRMGARPWLAHTQDDYARMLLVREEPGDRERAEELLADALATYRELGMESYAAKASALAVV